MKLIIKSLELYQVSIVSWAITLAAKDAQNQPQSIKHYALCQFSKLLVE